MRRYAVTVPAPALAPSGVERCKFCVDPAEFALPSGAALRHCRHAKPARFVQSERRMTKPIPSIEKYMTTLPHSIGRDQPLAAAHALMTKHRIRHLPVLEGGELIGVLSDRDLHLIETLHGVDPARVTVEEAMSTSVYAVTPQTKLDEVLSTMAERKYGCAIVIQNGHVVGLFTAVDACRSFAELLRTRLTH
jgi:acetoin utilization protein AcuB